MDNLKRPNTCIIGVTKSDEDGDFEEVMAEKISNLMIIINPHIQEAQRTLSKRNMKETTPKHIIIKLLKAIDKEQEVLKQPGERYQLRTE